MAKRTTGARVSQPRKKASSNVKSKSAGKRTSTAAKHDAILRMALQGKKIVQIAKETGYSADRLYHLLSEPAFAIRLSEIREVALAEEVHAYRATIDSMMERIARASKNDDDRVATAAAAKYVELSMKLFEQSVIMSRILELERRVCTDEERRTGRPESREVNGDRDWDAWLEQAKKVVRSRK